MTATPAEPTRRPGPGLPADDKHDDRPGTAARAGHAITGRDVRAALGGLSAEHRQVIVEIYYNSHSVYETADVLQVPAAKVTSRAYAALRQLLCGLAAPAATSSADTSQRTAAQPPLGACQR
jgi:RNA polymerase sigma-70 factor, ECF subfamily